MNVNALVKRGGEVVAQNQSTILTAVGVVGSVSTAILTGRAAFKAALRIREEEEGALSESVVIRSEKDWGSVEKIKLVAPEFIPPVMTGIATIAAIIMANRVSAKNAAALAAAYGVSQREFQDYKEKVRAALNGKGKEQAVEDAIAQDRVDQNPPDSAQVIFIGGGDVLCYDRFTGRYFYSTMEQIKQAEIKLQQEIIDRLYASASTFYNDIGLEPTDVTDIVGWRNGDGPSLRFSTTTTKDGKPCIVFTFDMMPYPEYDMVSH